MGTHTCCSRVYDYLSKHNLINDQQYTFRLGRSTALALVSILNETQLAWEDEQTILAVLTDLSKAFDTIDHPTLLS